MTEEQLKEYFQQIEDNFNVAVIFAAQACGLNNGTTCLHKIYTV